MADDRLGRGPRVGSALVGGTRSYDLKLDRAEKHFLDLQYELRRYSRSHPYEVRKRVENGRNVHRIHFTRQPDEELALMVGDILYNLRSSLDHVAASLVPSRRRSSSYFPIIWQGAWEPAVEGEDEERLEARRRWASYTEGMSDEALAIIQRTQPPDPAVDEATRRMHALVMLHKLRNTDAHTKLVLIAEALRFVVGRFTKPGGQVQTFTSAPEEVGDGYNDRAEIEDVPDGAVKVEITGATEVAIRVGNDGLALPLAANLNLMIDNVRRLLNELRPLDRWHPIDP